MTCKGIFIGKYLVYFDNAQDFVNAWPGIKMWIEVGGFRG